ncbi:MAG: hypothetical protein ACE5KT_01910 [Methanosarcinales archaeon]
MQILEDFDREIIEKAKKYVETEKLDVLGAIVDTFEMTQDKEYKSELYSIIKTIIKDFESFDRELAEWRVKKRASA